MAQKAGTPPLVTLADDNGLPYIPAGTNGGLTDGQLRATPVPVTIPTPVPISDTGLPAASTSAHTTAAANTAVVRTYAAVAGQSHRLTSLSSSWSGVVPTVGLITVQDGATTILELDVPLALNTLIAIPLPVGGIIGTANTDLVITLAAGGAGAIGKLNTSKMTG